MSQSTKVANIAYYSSLTTHDSTLSACAHAMAHCDVGDVEPAMGFFEKTVLTDVANLHNNTHYGIHTANMGGAWMCVVNGFAGFRVRATTEDPLNGDVCFAPRLPSAIQSTSFCVMVQNRIIKVSIDQQSTHYQLISGEALQIFHDKTPHMLCGESPLTLLNSTAH
jgi:alpha,alpha-trehalose phosphorylase